MEVGQGCSTAPVTKVFPSALQETHKHAGKAQPNRMLCNATQLPQEAQGIVLKLTNEQRALLHASSGHGCHAMPKRSFWRRAQNVLDPDSSNVIMDI